jgi:signal peptidase
VPRGLRVVGTVLSAAALLLAVGVALATVVVPRLMGASPYTVLTASMRPTWEPGTLVIVDPIDPAAVEIGDVITFQLEPGIPDVATHRVVGVNVTGDGRSFVTQGDANDSPDAEPVLPEQVRGRVAYAVPWMGHVNSAINSDTRSDLLVLGAVALIGYGVWQLGSGMLLRRRGAAESRDTDAQQDGHGCRDAR